MSERYCECCMYWKKKPRDDDYGWCRSHAPRPITYIMTDENLHESYDVRWPEVAFDDLCGEYDDE